jgi:hypothetical protein
MKITIESTTKIVHLNGIPARLWQGQTESGIKVHCFITRIAIDENELRTEEFEYELLEQKKPRTEFESYPLRMIL